MGAVEIVGEGQVFGKEIVGVYEHSGGTEGAAGSAGAVIENNHGLRRIGVGAAQVDVWLIDFEDLAVDAGRDGNDRAFGRCHVDGALDGIELAGAGGGDVKG